MNRIDVAQAELDMLRKRGFTERQITRFCHLRQRYGQDEMDQLPLDRRRLEFARWLVAKGRLTEQIV
jgi:hypothetical protein